MPPYATVIHPGRKGTGTSPHKAFIHYTYLPGLWHDAMTSDR